MLCDEAVIKAERVKPSTLKCSAHVRFTKSTSMRNDMVNMIWNQLMMFMTMALLMCMLSSTLREIYNKEHTTIFQEVGQNTSNGINIREVVVSRGTLGEPRN
ncbi:hypothetical protein C0989_003866 [Termitomyces sp. Mn162]|nr:hypothetical protein C0989_003866 [Termitomyces sp. Mn162]